MAYWLMKSEPAEFSVDNLETAPEQSVAWFGVRNYQARNFMRDDMRLDDLAFFYHSSCPEPGIAGIVKVSRLAFPDSTQFDPASKYYDPKASLDKPRWLNIEVQLVAKTRLLSLRELRLHPELSQMALLRPGNRLSITPVSNVEWQFITQLLQ